MLSFDIGAAVSKVYDIVGPSLFRQCGYIVCYNSHASDLRREIRDLRNAVDRLQHKVDHAVSVGEVVEQDVWTWLTDAEELIKSKNLFLEKDIVSCCFGFVPNPKARYVLGRGAKKSLPELRALIERGKFDEVSYHPAAELATEVKVRSAASSSSTVRYVDLKSRALVLKRIMADLNDHDRIGVYGMGGVGKTTLLRDVEKRARESGKFDDVVTVYVSQAPDIEGIKSKIRNKLGSLGSNEANKKTLLVLLDDLWSKLKEVESLEKDTKVKVKWVMTSRKQELLSNGMGCYPTISLGVLEEEEVWSFFGELVKNNTVEELKNNAVVAALLKKCAGLPVSIEALAKVLEKKGLSSSDLVMEDVLKLRKESIDGSASLELSYNYLGDTEVANLAKSLFQIIGLLGTPTVSILTLLKYTIGLPVVGSLPFLDPELHSYFAALAKNYGPVLKLRLGTKLGIVVSSPDAAKEVLRDHDVTFANRDVPAAGRAATYGGLDIVWSPYGPQWRMLRKVVVLKMLSNTTLDSVYELRRKEVRETVRYFRDRAGTPVNIGEQMFLLVLNTITNMVWGGTLEGSERGSMGVEFRQVVNEITALLGMPNVSDFFPSLARFDLQGVEKKMNVLAKRFDGIFEIVIEKRLKMEKEGGSDGGKKDFLQFLLKVKDEEDAKTPLSMTGVKALLMDIFIGGTDTSSNTVEFAMAELMKKPDIMNRVRQELDDVIGPDNIIEESDIHKLPYLRAVLNETLRLHPVVPLLVPHCPTADTTVAGFHIPKGSRVFINVWAIHRDPTVWENPTEFDPDRFFGNGKWDFSGNDFAYFPFGSGRRICAGIAMAERIMMYSLATLLHSFDWKLPAGEEKLFDVEEQFGIVLKKKVPLVVVPTPRLSSALYE